MKMSLSLTGETQSKHKQQVDRVVLMNKNAGERKQQTEQREKEAAALLTNTTQRKHSCTDEVQKALVNQARETSVLAENVREMELQVKELTEHLQEESKPRGSFPSRIVYSALRRFSSSDKSPPLFRRKSSLTRRRPSNEIGAALRSPPANTATKGKSKQGDPSAQYWERLVYITRACPQLLADLAGEIEENEDKNVKLEFAQIVMFRLFAAPQGEDRAEGSKPGMCTVKPEVLLLFIGMVLEHEFSVCNDKLWMRGNTVGMYLLSCLGKLQENAQFLKELLDPVVSQILAGSQKTCEEYVQQILDVIALKLKSSQFPQSLSWICRHLHGLVNKIHGTARISYENIDEGDSNEEVSDDHSTKSLQGREHVNALIGSFVFLRYINPYLTSHAVTASNVKTRQLIMNIARTLQHLSNGVYDNFVNADDGMESVVEENMEKIRWIFQNVVKVEHGLDKTVADLETFVQVEHCLNSQAGMPSIKVYMQDLLFLHNLISKYHSGLRIQLPPLTCPNQSSRKSIPKKLVSIQPVWSNVWCAPRRPISNEKTPKPDEEDDSSNINTTTSTHKVFVHLARNIVEEEKLDRKSGLFPSTSIEDHNSWWNEKQRCLNLLQASLAEKSNVLSHYLAIHGQTK